MADTEASNPETMQPDAVSANGVTESSGDLKPNNEVEDKMETAPEMVSAGNDVESQATKTDNRQPEGNVGACNSTPATDSVSTLELDETAATANPPCLTAPEEQVFAATVDGKSHDEGSSQSDTAVSASTTQQETVQEESLTSELNATEQQTTSETSCKSFMEQTSARVIKETVMTSSSSQETVSMTRVTTETNHQSSTNENLLDPEKVSELRRSPYYDSLIANRISMETEKISKSVQNGEQVAEESKETVQSLVNGVQHSSDPAQTACVNGFTTGELLAEQKDDTLKSVTSLKEACQEAVSSKVSNSATSSSQMFHVKKFEAKSCSEVKSSSEVTFDSSSFVNSAELFSSSQQTSETFAAAEVQSTEDMGVPPVNEDVPFRFSPNAYKPPADDMDFIDLPRKKKMFSSSSFYEEPNAIYPTVEEQVELCRKIADSLCDDSNKKSKGANMFFKRVKRAETWAVESMGTGYDNDYYEPSREEAMATPDPSNAPYVRVSKGPQQLKLILDPRHLLDMKRLRQEGMNIVEHNAVSPEICLGIVKDLNSPSGKGAQLFAKRKKKSEEWVVDEEKVKQLLRERDSGYTPSPEPPVVPYCGMGTEPLVRSRVHMVKTPWEAAMESPIGSCASAFKDLHPNEIAETVIRAAETKVMTYPAPVRPVIEPVIKPEFSVLQQNYSEAPVFAPAAPAFAPAAPVFTPAAPVFTPAAPVFTPVAPSFTPVAPSFTPAPQQYVKHPIPTSSFKAGVYTADPYKPRAPKGWTGTTSLGGSQFFSVQPPCYAVQEPAVQQPQLVENLAPAAAPVPSEPGTKLTHQPSFTKTYNFANFNKSPRAWSEAASAYESVHMKPVKPPSVLVQ